MIHFICSVLAFHYCSISFLYEPLWHLVLLACKHFTQAVTEPDSLTKGMRSLWQESPSFCCSPQRSRGSTLQASILNPRYRISEERTQSQPLFSPNIVKAGGVFQSSTGLHYFGSSISTSPEISHLTGPCMPTCRQFTVKCYVTWLFVSRALSLLQAAWISSGGFPSGSQKPLESKTVLNISVALPVPCTEAFSYVSNDDYRCWSF